MWTTDGRRILSAGSDGYIRDTRVVVVVVVVGNNNDQLQLKAYLSTPVRTFTAINRIWLPRDDEYEYEYDDNNNDDNDDDAPADHQNSNTSNSNNRITLGGYDGNEYVIIDFQTGYEFFRTDTEGRGRSLTISQLQNHHHHS